MDFIGEGSNPFTEGRGTRDLSSEGLDTSFELVLITRSEKETGSRIRR